MKTRNLITFFAGMLISITAYAQTFTANTPEGVAMTFYVTNSTDKTVQVGIGGYNSPAIDKSTTGSITIPATVSYGGVDYQVTSIGQYAFSGCSSLTSVDWTSCTSIGYYAFRDCSSLISVGDLSSYTFIREGTFYGCSSLTSVDLSSCTSIENCAFFYCSSLTSVGDLSSCTSIGGDAFSYCSSLTSVGDLSSCTSIGGDAFSYCSSLTSVGDLSSCTSIEYQAFYYCSSLTSVGDLSSCTSIVGDAFANCSSLTSVGDLSSCTSIEASAFYGCSSLTSITLPSAELVTLGNSIAIPRNTSVLVPSNLIESYKSAENWSDISSQLIPIGVQTVWDVDLTQTPSSTSSALMVAIGAANLANVIDLKITGDINGYDIFIMRNQMPNLHKLDMSDANIKASSDNFCYYDTHYTKDDELGDYAFYQQSKLVNVKLPKSIKSIGNNAFDCCNSLSNVKLYEGLTTVYHHAFYGCLGLREITIPEGVTWIDTWAFADCNNLTSVVFPSTLKKINERVFCNCNLQSLTLPSALQTIGDNAFSYNSPLSEVILPAGLQTIGGEAFAACSNIKTVKASAIDPNAVTLAADAFPTTVFANATLYIPYDEDTGWNATYNAYFWHTRWGQFTNKDVWKPTYDYVTIGGDYEQTTGTIPGEDINADMGNESGYIVGENGEQDFNEVNIDDNGTSGGSIIADGDVSINDLYCNISVVANRWYFFCFPFDLHLKDNIRYDGSYVWHKYDGEARANNGNGGWKKMGSNAVLKAGQGYIFQGNKTGTLTIVVSEPDLKRKDKNQDLDTWTASNAQDASWNLVGNPYLSYYDMDEIGFDAPITIWNGTNYDAVRPGDDDYHFQPYQAFFVQKPSGTTSLTFDGNGQETYHQSQTAASNVRERRASAKHSDRRIVNLRVSDGEVTDKTRVVLNESKSRAYEMECDASKFFSEENVPQIYTIDGDVNYAINERPIETGTVTLGFKANKEGEFTISAPRMDADCLLKDNETGLVFNLQNGSYTFSSKAGTFGQRFTLIFTEETTAIKKAEAELDGKNEALFDLSGRKAQEGQSGILIKDGQKIIMK